MLALSLIAFSIFFQSDTILVGGERVASTPQGILCVCAHVCVCPLDTDNILITTASRSQWCPL